MENDGGRGPVLSRIRTSAVVSIALALLLTFGLKVSLNSGAGSLLSNTEVKADAGNEVRVDTANNTSSTLLAIQDPDHFDEKIDNLEAERRAELKRKQQERQAKINKVEAFFASYGAVMQGYAHILVDQADKCGGDYRVLVGIAGSESGLGRIMYKKYNPYGYLDGVQYSSLEEALTVLSCRISQKHIAPCNGNLTCIAERYTGKKDDVSHFIGKVDWFMDQVS